jgi:Ca-activated chloride channel family protein
VDTTELEDVAEKTGGIFRTATDEKSLRAVYEEIDKLEKSEIESIRFLDYRELFGPFALAGLFLVAFEVFLSCTVFRRIP